MNQIVILAAGKGTRMNSDLPKTLVPVNGKPMIFYILETIFASGLDKEPIVVVSPDNVEIIKSALKDYPLRYALQKEQLGSGHALKSAKGLIKPGTKKIFVVYCDHPFLKPESLLAAAAVPVESIIVMTTKLPDFSGWHQNFKHWGRFVRDAAGNILKIVEFKDASPEQRAITEVNPGFMVFSNDWLWENIEKISDNNAQKEYYLTTLPGVATAGGYQISSIPIEPLEALGVNSQEELALAEEAASKFV
jgi:bifunctional UDP-N-acetylglucosamine pyrophosphorylase/glucosamine-1-phosphate N-acetyltransferase